MRFANVPPPMAQHEVTLESNAVDVAISPVTQDPNTVTIAVLHDDGCSFYSWSLESRAQKPPSPVWASGFPTRKALPEMMNAQIAYGTNGFFVHLSQEPSGSKVWILDEDSNAPSRHFCHFGKTVEGIITNGPNSASTTYLMPDQNEMIGPEDLEVEIYGYNERNDSVFGLFRPLKPAVDAIRWEKESEPPANGLLNGASRHAIEAVVFSLSESGSLFANDRRLARNCTSFLVTPAHLIFTTSQHLLKFVHLGEKVDGMNQHHKLDHSND